MRYTDVVSVRLKGDVALARQHIAFARVQLGRMISYLGKGVSGSLERTYPGGPTIRTLVAGTLHIIEIEIGGGFVEEEFILWGFFCYPVSDSFPRGYVDNTDTATDPPAREPYIFIQPQPSGLGPPIPPISYKGYQYSGSFGPKAPAPLPQTEKYKKWFGADLSSEFGEACVIAGNCDWRGVEQKDPKTNWVHQDIVTWDGPMSRHGNYYMYNPEQFDGIPPGYNNYQGLTHPGMFFRTEYPDFGDDPQLAIREIIKPPDAATTHANYLDYFKVARMRLVGLDGPFDSAVDYYNNVFYNGVRIKHGLVQNISGACVKVDLDAEGKTQHRVLLVVATQYYPGFTTSPGQSRVVREAFVCYNFDPGSGEVSNQIIALDKPWSTHSSGNLDDSDPLYDNGSIWIFNASCTKGITDRSQQYVNATSTYVGQYGFRKQVNADIIWTPAGCSVVLSDGDFNIDRALDIVVNTSKVRTYLRRFRDFDGDTLIEGRLETHFSRTWSGTHTSGGGSTHDDGTGTDSYYARLYIGADLIWERVDPDESWSYSRTTTSSPASVVGTLARSPLNFARVAFVDYLDLRSKTANVLSVTKDVTGLNPDASGNALITMENLVFQNGVQVASNSHVYTIAGSAFGSAGTGVALGNETTSVSTTGHTVWTQDIVADSDHRTDNWVDYTSNSWSPRANTFSGVHSWFRTAEGKLSCFSSAPDNSSGSAFSGNISADTGIPFFQTVLTDGNVPLLTGLSGDNKGFVPIKILPYAKSKLRLKRET